MATRYQMSWYSAKTSKQLERRVLRESHNVSLDFEERKQLAAGLAEAVIQWLELGDVPVVDSPEDEIWDQVSRWIEKLPGLKEANIHDEFVVRFGYRFEKREARYHAESPDRELEES